MKKHLHYALIFIFLACSLQAQVVGWNQPTSGTPTVFSIGTSNSGVEVGRSICIDAAGNTYVYGTFAGTADFDPSAASTTATASGTSSDLFIAKYNAAGAFQWVARGGVANIGDNASGNIGSIKTDGTNVYVVGSLPVSTAVATFTPVGSCTTCTVPSNATTTRGFVGNLDAATGNWQWINTFGGIGTTQNGGNGLCLDPTGNLYVSGQCNGTFTLGALPQISTADAELFFGKLNAAGTWQWATTAGGTGGDGAGQSGSGITYNTNLNRLAASGSYNSSGTTFGAFSLPTSSTTDIFLAEINPTTGAFLSAFGLGGAGASDECGGIVYDPNTNDIFLAGQMSGSLTLPGFGTLAQASASNDIFVGRFTPNATPTNGVFSWAKSYGLSGLDRAYDIATNANGNIYIAGWFSGSGTIDFGSGTPTQVTSTGTGNEIFVASLTVGGTGVWAMQGTENGGLLDQARGVCAAQNTSGTVYATGQFNTGTVSWTPSSNGNAISLTNAGGIGGQDVWVGKIYGTAGTILTTGTTTAFTSCASAVSAAQNFTISGSALTTNITVTAPTGFEVSLTAGSGYASSISLTQSSGTVATTTVYVRLSTTATGTPSGNVACASPGAATQNVAVSGSVSAIILTPASQTNVACNGGSTGAATVNAATGGTGPYTYDWSPGTPTGDGTVSVTGLTPGAWTCTVTDNAGCSTTRNFTITQPPAISTAIAAQTNVSCFGGSNGSASVTPSGGAGGYTYSWSPSGGTAATATGLSAGSYTVTVTDANSCTATRNFVITQPTALSVTPAAQTNVSCFGGSNGAASINTPTGGTPGYTYDWTPGTPTGDGTNSVTGLTAGTWTCTVTDANGCTRAQSFTVTQSPAISVTPASQTNVSCFGGSNGAATINTPTGGTPGYTYDWTPGTPTGDGTTSVTGLTAGTWTCTVTDANGCTRTQSFTVTQPPAISITPASQTNVSCFGGSNGAAAINTPTGGVGGYTYNWTPGNPTGDGTTSVTGLTAGTWTCTVTDANGCTRAQNFTVTQSAAISVTPASQTNVSCFGGSNGAAAINTPTGGAGGYTYNWTPGNPTGDGTTSVTGLTAGTWTCTVTDANGCTRAQNFTVTQTPAISVTPASQTNVSCFGGSNGAAAINTPTGGAGGYTYNWTPGNPTGDGTTSVTGLTAGIWTCTVTDANGCTITQNFTVIQPTAISVTPASQTNIACNGSSTGAATINTPTGGAGGYTYDWSPGTPTGDGTTSVTGLNAGTYTVTVTDANGCTTTQSFTVTQPTALVATPASQTNVSCFGGSNGTATVSVSGGTSAYTYAWSPSGGTAATATGLSAGTYTVTVTDANACTASRNFIITQPTIISTATAAQTNVSCNGGSNGSASVTPSGGAGGYTYSWSPSGGTAATATGLSAGTYTVTVTDANACTASRNFIITQPTTISTATAAQTNVSCNGGSNGSASVTPSGGAGGYTYSWAPSGGTAATATGLTAGTYTVTVTDANACTASRNFIITQPTAIVATAASKTNVSCNGGSNGAASINIPTGGAGGYTYNWTPGNPTGDGTRSVTGLIAGAWTCTVTDANGCTTVVNFTITQPTIISTATAAQTNVSCNGGSNGSASVTPSGGAGGYTYSWSPSGGTAATATGLSAGTYTVTVTDANACTASRNFIITQPTIISTASAAQTNVSCNGGSNGSASVTPSGGAGGYTYSWSPSGGTAATATGLSAGTYTVTVTDANACTTSRNFVITQPTTISTATAAQTNVSCNGGSNGSASVTPSGGAGGYTYSWSPSGGTAATATGLSAGTYTVTVTDSNACTASRNFTITQPTPINTATAAQTNVSCNGGSNGSASVTPSGGAGGYTYSWSPSGGTAATATGLSAGTYTVTVTDANSCTATRNFTITQPTAISTATAAQTNVSCNGGSNGSASVTPSGGAGGYTYSWSPSGGTAATATGLSAGTYTVTVTDANSCTATRNFTITQPTAISTATAAQTNVSCNGGSNGSASVTPSGGAGGYTYSWSPSGGTAATATGLSAGTYTVTVTDANACTATRNFTITQPTVISMATAMQTNVSCNSGSNGSASVTPSGGAGGYTYSWSPSGGTAATATGLTAGTYTVTVTDANACTASRNFVITQPTTISAATGAQTNVSCNGGSNGSASVTPSGGAGGYTYSWSPSGGTAATANGLSAGTYTVTVTDANACTASRNFVITQPTAINFTTTVLSGYDYNTGYSQTVVASGGTGAKTYAVTTGSLPSGFALSAAGQITGISTQIADSNFTVTATDANSCTATYNYVLKLNQIPITVTATPSQTKVYGESDPVLTYTVSPSLLSGDSFTGSLTRVSGENIGNYAINQGSLTAGSKYLITYVGANFTITAKPITVTANASQTKVYGTTDAAFAYTVSPSLVGGDSFTGALTRVAGENIGTYAINQGSLSAGSNYTISYAAANFTVTAKPITVAATPSQTKVYGTTDAAFAYTVSPSLVGGDSFTGALTRVAGENIGNYVITQGNLSAGSNYNITYVSKDFVITAKPITVTADGSQTKVYGVTNPVYSYTFSPSLVSGDSFSGTLTRAAGENIGNYIITQGTLSAGSNYNISYVSKDFTITAKPIIVTANTAQTKVYGTTNPVYAYTVSPSLVSGDSFTGSLTRTVGENVGTYPITQGTLSAGGNYSITYNGSNFTITKADQVITWNQTLGLGCNGEASVVLTAVSNSGLAINYTSSNTSTATVSNNSLFFQNYGSATVTASQPGNMNYNAAPTVVLPVVASQPNLIRKQFEDIIFFDNSSKNFKSYTWYKNGVLVLGQTSQYFKESGALNGTYYAVATKLDGTIITSCPLTLSPTIEEEYMRVVPNPVNSNASFQLITNVSASRLQNARVEIFNLTGNLLNTVNTSQNTINMTAPGAEGIYIVKITLTNGKYFTKNLLVRN